MGGGGVEGPASASRPGGQPLDPYGLLSYTKHTSRACPTKGGQVRLEPSPAPQPLTPASSSLVNLRSFVGKAPAQTSVNFTVSLYFYSLAHLVKEPD